MVELYLHSPIRVCDAVLNEAQGQLYFYFELQYIYENVHLWLYVKQTLLRIRGPNHGVF
jgi:hypothetical protein